MQATTSRRALPVITVDGNGVVSHAGAALLRELASVAGWSTKSRHFRPHTRSLRPSLAQALFLPWYLGSAFEPRRRERRAKQPATEVRSGPPWPVVFVQVSKVTSVRRWSC